MRTREIITLVLGLAVVAGFVVTVKTKESRNDEVSPATTAASQDEGNTLRQPQHSDAGKLPKNGPAKTDRTLAQYTQKKGLNIMHDGDLPLSASGLVEDLEFHAYADAAPDGDSQWIPITVDYYDLKTGTIGIRSTANEIREPLRGWFLLTRVPR
jgi:hypothetical protein